MSPLTASHENTQLFAHVKQIPNNKVCKHQQALRVKNKKIHQQVPQESSLSLFLVQRTALRVLCQLAAFFT